MIVAPVRADHPNLASNADRVQPGQTPQVTGRTSRPTQAVPAGGEALHGHLLKVAHGQHRPPLFPELY